jgi:hypothetical protein
LKGLLGIGTGKTFSECRIQETGYKMHAIIPDFPAGRSQWVIGNIQEATVASLRSEVSDCTYLS